MGLDHLAKIQYTMMEFCRLSRVNENGDGKNDRKTDKLT